MQQIWVEEVSNGSQLPNCFVALTAATTGCNGFKKKSYKSFHIGSSHHTAWTNVNASDSKKVEAPAVKVKTGLGGNLHADSHWPVWKATENTANLTLQILEHLLHYLSV